MIKISADLLRELHRIHRQKTDLKSRLARGPRQIRAGEGKIQSAEQELEQARDNHRQAQLRSNEKQLQLKEREQRIEDIKRKLNEAKSNKEFSTFKEQIAADEQANSVLSDEILESLEQLDHLEALCQKAEQVLVDANTSQEELKQKLQKLQVELEDEVTRVEGQLVEAEKLIPADFKVDYERLVKARGEEALAPLEGETCGGCATMLSPQLMNELLMGFLKICRSCGNVLYVPEDRSL